MPLLPLPALGAPGIPDLWAHPPVSASVVPWLPCVRQVSFSLIRKLVLDLGPACLSPGKETRAKSVMI